MALCTKKSHRHMASCPHVAKAKASLESVKQCSEDEALTRLQKLKTVIEAMSVALKRPGLIGQHAIDSIGTYLTPRSAEMSASNPLAEKIRVFFMEGVLDEELSCPSVELLALTHCVMDYKTAEALEPADRLSCLAIKATKQVARRYNATERKLAEIRVSFENGSKVEVREQPVASNAVIVFTRPGNVLTEKTILEAKINPSLLGLLFEGVGKGRFAASVEDDLHARPCDQGWLLPPWLSEHIATFAQNLLRLHVLCSAGDSEGPSAAKILYVEHSKLSRKGGDEQVLITTDLHAASGGCVCSMHGKRPCSRFVKLQLCIEVCGRALAFVDGKVCCDVHYGDLSLESTNFPGMCKRGLKVYLICVHERVENQSKTTKVDFTHVIDGWRLESMRELACCCVKATLPGCEVLDLIADADALNTNVEQQCLSKAHTNDKLAELDNTAYWMLRSGVAEAKNGKLVKKKKIKLTDVSKTHLHLFKKNK